MNVLSVAATIFGVICGLAPLAQAARIQVRHSAEEVSLVWLLLYACGAGVWLGYGAAEGSMPLLASQAVALASVTVTLALAGRARSRVRRRHASVVEGATWAESAGGAHGPRTSIRGH